MDAEFVDLTAEHLADEHLCCIIRTKKAHPGVEAKRRWLSDRLREGHVFRKLNAKGVVFIEYAPLETAWVPVIGDNYYYIYCLWVAGPYKGKGYAKALMEHCLADARTHGKSGVCMRGAEKQKAWLSDQSFARKFGFEVVDTTDNGYELLALSFDGTTPKFAENAKKMTIESQTLTVYYDMQCPFIPGNLEMIRQHCEAHGVPADFIEVDTLRKAKELPCVFNNWAIFFNPLCPASLPFGFRRKVPNGNARSSTTINRFSTGMFSFCNQYRTALPLRFIKVFGFSTIKSQFFTRMRAIAPYRSSVKLPPTLSTKWLTTRKPIL